MVDLVATVAAIGIDFFAGAFFVVRLGFNGAKTRLFWARLSLHSSFFTATLRADRRSIGTTVGDVSGDAASSAIEVAVVVVVSREELDIEVDADPEESKEVKRPIGAMSTTSAVVSIATKSALVGRPRFLIRGGNDESLSIIPTSSSALTSMLSGATRFLFKDVIGLKMGWSSSSDIGFNDPNVALAS